jgi:hypothetical protein
MSSSSLLRKLHIAQENQQSFSTGLLPPIFRSVYALSGPEEAVDKQRQNVMCNHWWRQDHYHRWGVYWIVPLDLLGKVFRDRPAKWMDARKGNFSFKGWSNDAYQQNNSICNWIQAQQERDKLKAMKLGFLDYAIKQYGRGTKRTWSGILDKGPEILMNW